MPEHREDSARGDTPTIVERILGGEIDLIFNTPGEATHGQSRVDGYQIRTAAVMADVPLVTTVPGLAAAVQGIESLRDGRIEVRSLQEWAQPGKGL